MSEWWTYRPSDFLMFAPRTYWRLFELHNQAAGPLLWLLLAAGLAGLVLLARPRPPWRWLLGALALGWLAVGLGFVLLRYAPVFWAMEAAAWGFVGVAVALGSLAAAGGLQAAPGQVARRGGLLLWGWALAGQPWLALLAGRPLGQAEVLGLAPDPTAFASLGLLLCIAPPAGARRMLYEAVWVLVLAWCVFSAATLWTMGSAQGGVPALVAAVAMSLRRWGKRRPAPA